MRYHNFYWFLPILLFVFQAIYTFNTLNQIRYEEIEESVVNPYWVANRVVQNGASGNLGWHFLLILVYNIFGFSLFTGKFVRLALQLVSLFCLAAVLKRFLGARGAFLPLLTIGLSPTLLYFNTQETVYGIDLQYFPIILYLATLLNFAKRENLIIQIAVWSLAMIASMSYPTFIYYLPALVFFYLYKLLKNPGRKREFFIKNLLIAFVAFILPLVVVFFYVHNRNLLIYDENVKSGMFRGAGFVRLSLEQFFNNLKLNLVNLFSKSYGYYFEIKKVEFSDFYPVVAIAFTGLIIFKLWRKKRNLRLFILLGLSILILNILLAYFTVDPTPGMRRQTGSLVAIYIFFVLGWYWVVTQVKNQKLKLFYISMLLLLFLHHLIVYPINLRHLKDPSRFREQLWFKDTDDPRKTLEEAVQAVQEQDLRLKCFGKGGEALNCRYSEMFALASASCWWNKLVCHGVYGYDLKTKSLIKLSIENFNNYYFGRYGQEIIAN